MTNLKNFRLVGVGSTLQFGKNNATLVASSTNSQFKDKTQSTLTTVEFATPTISTHGANKGYVDAAITSSLSNALPGLKTGQYYDPFWNSNGNLSAITFASNTIVASPTWWPSGFTFNRIGVEATNSGSGRSLRIGLYTHNYSTNQPTTLILDSGTMSNTTTGAKEATISWTSSGEIVWLVYVGNNSAQQMRGFTQTTADNMGYYFGRSAVNTAVARMYTATLTFGAFPATFPTASASTTNNNPLIWLRSA